ncbi:LemA family protein [Archangium violaceum]|uniref:LemA family protein n=1 Tax=Archangium violaceum Cb vi76 TaxID=1406225 RepID=A0A084SYT0_9BACT|nr:LemA family protein [Archangium violaceum]KFA93615.1 LemA family protein [Archangium violaceum Cb vi76]
MGKWLGLGLVALLVLLGLGAVGSYNSLVRLEQAVDAQWGQVENVYQRRLDLVPNLVATVKGAASFEQQTLTQVIEARAKASQVSLTASRELLEEPAAFQQFQQAQQNLSGALSRLLVTVERYPELRATENFRELQAQLEGTENRIAVERMRFNEAARAFNTRRNSFPTVLFAGFFGRRFAERPYFQAEPGAKTAPEVRF